MRNEKLPEGRLCVFKIFFCFIPWKFFPPEYVSFSSKNILKKGSDENYLNKILEIKGKQECLSFVLISQQIEKSLNMFLRTLERTRIQPIKQIDTDLVYHC